LSCSSSYSRSCEFSRLLLSSIELSLPFVHRFVHLVSQTNNLNNNPPGSNPECAFSTLPSPSYPHAALIAPILHFLNRRNRLVSIFPPLPPTIRRAFYSLFPLPPSYHLTRLFALPAMSSSLVVSHRQYHLTRATLSSPVSYVFMTLALALSLFYLRTFLHMRPDGRCQSTSAIVPTMPAVHLCRYHYSNLLREEIKSYVHRFAAGKLRSPKEAQRIQISPNAPPISHLTI
jgi:hypothetical protein